MAPSKAAEAHLLPLHRPEPQALQSPQTPSGAAATSAPAQQGASQPRRRAQHPQPPHQQRHPAALCWQVVLRDHRVHQGWWCPFGGPVHLYSWCCWWALGSCWRPQSRSPPGHALVCHSHRAASSLHSAQAACQDSSAAQLRTACLLEAAHVEHFGQGHSNWQAPAIIKLMPSKGMS